MTSSPISIAANNGSVGGGEVMLLNIAHALRELGRPPTIIAPLGSDAVSELADEARSRDFRVVGLPAESRLDWMRALRAWDRRNRNGILWCNGLLPAVATSGHRDRIVHLHQQPQSRAQRALFGLARQRAMRVTVPSNHLAELLPGTTALENWCEPVAMAPDAEFLNIDGPSGVTRVGFLGRPTMEKGIAALSGAISHLDHLVPGSTRLVIAGSPKFSTPSGAASVAAALQPIDHLVDRLGWVEPSELFAQIDVLVVPSLAPESFGLVAAEAMSARLPVIVSDAGALPEVVGPDGVVVPSGDARHLAAAISSTIADPEGAHIRTEALYNRWASKYSPSAGRERVAELLAEIRQ